MARATLPRSFAVPRSVRAGKPRFPQVCGINGKEKEARQVLLLEEVDRAGGWGTL